MPGFDQGLGKKTPNLLWINHSKLSLLNTNEEAFIHKSASYRSTRMQTLILNLAGTMTLALALVAIGQRNIALIPINEATSHLLIAVSKYRFTQNPTEALRLAETTYAIDSQHVKFVIKDKPPQKFYRARKTKRIFVRNIFLQGSKFLLA